MKRSWFAPLGLVLLLGGIVWYLYLPRETADFFALLPRENIRGVVFLGEDASEQGVRAWLDEWFFLKKIAPLHKIFIRHFFPYQSMLAIYPPSKPGERFDWLYIGELGRKTTTLRILRFWWEKELSSLLSDNIKITDLTNDGTRVYTAPGINSGSFFIRQNKIFICSSQSVLNTEINLLANNQGSGFSPPREIGQDFMTTDADRDGNFYLDNRDRFWRVFSTEGKKIAGIQPAQLLDQVKQIRGNFDFVDLNRLRFIFFFKLDKDFLAKGQTILKQWGGLLTTQAALLGIRLEYKLKVHPDWEEIRLLFYPHKLERYFGYLENAAADKTARTGSSFINLKLQESKLGEPAWSLSAAEASIDQKETSVICRQLNFRWFDKDKEQARLTSETGIVRREPLSVTASGKVTLVAGENTVETEELVWDSQLDLITTERPVKITRKDDIMTGVGLRATPDLRNIEILKDVVIRLKELPEIEGAGP